MHIAADACTFSLPVTGFAVDRLLTWAVLVVVAGVALVAIAHRAGRRNAGLAALVLALAFGPAVDARTADAACVPAVGGVAAGTTTTTQVGSFGPVAPTTTAAAAGTSTTSIATTSTTVGGSSSTTSTTVVGSSPTPPAEIPEVPVAVLAPLSGAALVGVILAARRRRAPAR